MSTARLHFQTCLDRPQTAFLLLSQSAAWLAWPVLLCAEKRKLTTSARGRRGRSHLHRINIKATHRYCTVGLIDTVTETGTKLMLLKQSITMEESGLPLAGKPAVTIDNPQGVTGISCFDARGEPEGKVETVSLKLQKPYLMVPAAVLS